MTLLSAVALCGCEFPPDSVSHNVRVFSGGDDLGTRIDGIERNDLSLELGWSEYVCLLVNIESYHLATGQLLDAREIGTGCHQDGYVDSSRISFCQLQNGQLAFASGQCGDGGVADGFCTLCPLDRETAAGDLRCGFVQVLAEPEILHLKFGFPGTIALGERCSWGPPGPENYDPCEAGSLCHDGTCQRLCASSNNTACQDLPGTACRPLDSLGKLFNHIEASGTCRD